MNRIENRDSFLKTTLSSENIQLPEPSKSSVVIQNHLPSLATEKKEINEDISKFNNNLLSELDNLISFSDKEIEQSLVDLENGIELADATLDLEILMNSYPAASLKIAANFTEFFSTVLPPKVMDISGIEHCLSLTNEIASLGRVFLSSLNNGTQFISAICKHKMLKDSRKLLAKLKLEFQNKTALSDPAASPEITKEIKETSQALFEWEESLKIEEEKLKAEKYNLVSSSIITFFWGTFEILNLFPLTRISSLAAQIATTGISIGGDTFIFIVREIELIKVLLKRVSLKTIRSSYDKWSEKHTPTLDKTRPSSFKLSEKTKEIYSLEEEILHLITKESSIEEIEKKIEAYLRLNPNYNQALNELPDLTQASLQYLDVIVNNTKNLLHKRQAITQKKFILIRAEFEQSRPKIEERNRFLYEQKLIRVHEILRDPFSDPATIEKKLNSLVFLMEEEKYTSLMGAFQKYQAAVLSNEESLSIEAKQTDLANEFYAWMLNAQTIEQQFQEWFLVQPQDKLIGNYVDYQETIQQRVKNALREIIKHKQALENKFLNLDLFSNGTLAALALLCVSVTVGGVIVSLLAPPVVGLGILLLITTIGPSTLNLGFMLLTFLYRLHQKPHTTKAWTLQPKTNWKRLQHAFYAYKHNVKKKKLWETSVILRQLYRIQPNKTNPGYQEAFDNYQKAKIEFDSSKEKIKTLTQRLTELERDLAAKGWRDFVHHAFLTFSDNPKIFDSLRALAEGLLKCDIANLDPELKYLLEKQCGINLADLQAQIKQDPQAISAALQAYSALNIEGMIQILENFRLPALKERFNGSYTATNDFN